VSNRREGKKRAKRITVSQPPIGFPLQRINPAARPLSPPLPVHCEFTITPTPSFEATKVSHLLELPAMDSLKLKCIVRWSGCNQP
jgi:hypothetical protein